MKPAGWIVRFVMREADGRRQGHEADLPDELAALRFLDICRRVPTCVAACAEPLDSRSG